MKLFDEAREKQLDELKARRADPDDSLYDGDFDGDELDLSSERGRREYLRHMRPRARAQDKQAKELFEAGRKEERERRQRSSSSTRPKAGRRSSTSRAVRRGADQAVAPLRSTVTSWSRLAVLAVGLTALYQLLEGADQAAGFIGGAAKGLEWLRRPDRSIPYPPT